MDETGTCPQYGIVGEKVKAENFFEKTKTWQYTNAIPFHTFRSRNSKTLFKQYEVPIGFESAYKTIIFMEL